MTRATELADRLEKRALERNGAAPCGVGDDDFETMGFYSQGDSIFDRKAAALLRELDEECQQSMLEICRERDRADKAESALLSTRNAALEEAAGVADKHESIAKSHPMFPAFCTNAQAETAAALAVSIRAKAEAVK